MELASNSSAPPARVSRGLGRPPDSGRQPRKPAYEAHWSQSRKTLSVRLKKRRQVSRVNSPRRCRIIAAAISNSSAAQFLNWLRESGNCPRARRARQGRLGAETWEAKSNRSVFKKRAGAGL